MQDEQTRRGFCRQLTGVGGLVGAGVAHSNPVAGTSQEATGNQPVGRPRRLTTTAKSATAEDASSRAVRQSGDEWPLFGYDDQNTSRRRDGPTPPLTESWTQETPWEMSVSYPIMVDNLVYCSTANGIATISQNTGQPGRKESAQAPVTSPGAAGDSVYFCTRNGFLTRLYTTEGRLVNHDIGGDLYASPVPRPDGDVFVASRDGQVRRIGTTDDVTRLDWETATPGGVIGTPAVTDGTVYVADEAGVVSAINADSGTIEWRRELPDEFSASPAVRDGQLYLVGDGGRTYALGAADGALVWQSEMDGDRVSDDVIASSPALADGRVIVGSVGGTIYAFDAADGEPAWTVETNGAVHADPMIADATVYAASADGTVYGLSLADGTERWQTSVNTFPAGLAATADAVIVTTGSGRVQSFESGIDGGPAEGSGGDNKEADDPSLDGLFGPLAGLLQLAVGAMVSVVALLFALAFIGGLLSGLFSDGGSGDGRTGGSNGPGGSSRSGKSSQKKLKTEKDVEVDKYGQLVDDDE